MTVTGSVADGRHLEQSAVVQKSFSMRDEGDGHAVEDWGSPTTQSASASPTRSQLRAVSARARKHRVTFSLVEDLDDLEQTRHEKWREPIIVTHKQILAAAKNNCDDMRYNYEQPGFVEREKDGATGRAYTIYRVNGTKDCSKGSPNPSSQLPLVRAFSTKQKNVRYSRMSRSFSLSTGKHALPVGCVACGLGMGTVVSGFPGQNDSSVCKSCESTMARAPGSGGWKCSDDTKVAKKNSILDYCRRLLGSPKSVR